MLSIWYYLCVYFLVLSTWYSTTNWCTFLWASLSSSQHYSVAYRSCVELKPCWNFPSTFNLVQLVFRQSCWWDFLGVASDFPAGHNHIEISNSLSPIILLLPLLQWFFQRNFFIQQTGIITDPNQSKLRVVEPSPNGYI